MDVEKGIVLNKFSEPVTFFNVSYRIYKRTGKLAIYYN